MSEPAFCYRSRCSCPGCRGTPRFKIAATWVSGPLREWKTYGLACDAHRDELLNRARTHRAGLPRTDEEEVGPVEVFGLDPTPASHVGDLSCLADDALR